MLPPDIFNTAIQKRLDTDEVEFVGTLKSINVAVPMYGSEQLTKMLWADSMIDILRDVIDRLEEYRESV